MESQAFRRLAIAEFDSVYRMAMHLVRHPDQASDLAQETYLRAFQAEKNFQLHDKGVKPWLFKILHNTYFTKLSKQRREQALLEQLNHEAASNELTDGGLNWRVESLDWEQVDDRLKHAVEQLPEHYREVLLLWAVEGLKYREIADVLGVPQGTVMSRLYRARAILNQKLAPFAAEHRLRVEQ